jgi:hypothetical protein
MNEQSTIKRTHTPNRKVEIYHLQLGNPIDTDGAHLVEAVLVGSLKFAMSGFGAHYFLYNENGHIQMAEAINIGEAPDFPEHMAQEAESRNFAYSTKSLPVETDRPESYGHDTETTFGISHFWLQNNWWLEEAKTLNPEPLAVNKD